MKPHKKYFLTASLFLFLFISTGIAYASSSTFLTQAQQFINRNCNRKVLADQATTVVGRGVSMAMYVQSLSQLEAVYGRAYSRILTDNMETQLYYPPIDFTTSKYIEEWLGRQSAYAHSTTLKEGEETSQGLSEQGIPLMTAQEIRQLKDEEIIGFHRHLPPFRMKRVDWRHHTTLKQRRSIPSPQLPTLPPVAEDIPMRSREQSTYDLIDPDMLN